MQHLLWMMITAWSTVIQLFLTAGRAFDGVYEFMSAHLYTININERLQKMLHVCSDFF